MKIISLIIYDLDGTLVDTKRDIASSVDMMTEELGLPKIPDEVIFNFVGRGIQPLVKDCVGKDNEAKLTEALHIFQKHYQEHLADTSKLFPGMEKIIDHFHNKKQVVLTNKSQGFTDLLLAGLDIEHHFSSVIGAGANFPRKPDPASTLHLLKEFNASPSETVIIGDTNVDIEVGKNAGILTCGVTWGFCPRKEVEDAKPDYIIDKPEELISLFE